MKQVAQQVVILAQKFGDALAPSLMSVMDSLVPVFKWLTKLSPATQKMIFFVGIAAAALGPLLIAIGALSKILPFALLGVKALSTSLIFLATNPIGWVILGVGALTTGLVLLIKNWKSIGAWLKNVWSAVIDKVINDFYGLVEGIKKAWELIKVLGKAIAKIGFGINGEVSVNQAPENRVNASPMIWGNQPWMITQQARQEATSKVDVNFRNPPKGLTVQAEDGGNLGEITRGFATAGVR